MTTTLRAPAPLPKFLWQKEGARHLWFRMSVPQRYRSIEDRRIIQRDLKTSDLRHAEILAGGIRAELHAEWQQRVLRQGADIRSRSTPSSSPTEPTLFELQVDAVQAGYTAVLPRLKELIRQKALHTEQQYQTLLNDLSRHMRRFVRSRDDPNFDLWRRCADKRITLNNWRLPSDHPNYDRFVDMIASAGIEAFRIEREHREGNFGAEPTSPIVVDGIVGKKQLAVPGETITELFEKYAKQRLAEGRKRRDTINQDRKVIEGFATFVGSKRGLRSIQPADVREWRDTLASVPRGYQNRKDMAGLSLRQVAAKATNTEAKSITLTSINKYLSTVSPLFDWARGQGYVDHNPCDGLYFDVVKGKNPRPPFNTDQLNNVLTSPLFTGFLRDGREYKPGTERAQDWRYWIPLICLFTGARISEVAQLRVEDIWQEQDIWLIHIRNDEATGQKTKSGKTRITAAHSMLQQIGFIKFVEKQQARAAKDGNAQLFLDLTLDSRETMGGRPSRFWRNYLTRIGVKNGADGLGSHSFRHGLADELRGEDFLDNEIGVALGHSQKTVTSGYGRLRQGTAARISGMIESVKFEGVRFDHLIPKAS